MFPHREYARERVAREAARLAERIYAERAPLELSLPLGTDLGPLFSTHWLRAVGTVPRAWADARVDLLLETGGEATLWIGGLPVQGLSTGGRQPRPEAMLFERAQGGDAVDVELELASNDPFGFGESGQGRELDFVLRRCELARFDREAWDVWCDFSLLAALESAPGVDEAWAGELLAQLYAFTVDGDRRRLAALLARGSGSLLELSAVGHAHLDTAWLWPLEETWRKLVRTTTAQLRLLDAYPEYVFAHSQAQHYAWLEEREPELFDARARRPSPPAAGSRSAAAGSSPTATCRRESRWRDSSSTASATSSARSGAAAGSSGTPTCSATRRSCRSCCARRA